VFRRPHQPAQENQGGRRDDDDPDQDEIDEFRGRPPAR